MLQNCSMTQTTPQGRLQWLSLQLQAHALCVGSFMPGCREVRKSSGVGGILVATVSLGPRCAGSHVYGSLGWALDHAHHVGLKPCYESLLGFSGQCTGLGGGGVNPESGYIRSLSGASRATTLLIPACNLRLPCAPCEPQA